MKIDNLKHWPTPASPNSASRPKHTPISDAIRHLLAQPDPDDQLGRTNAEVIASALIARARAGDLRALMLILETEGEPGTRSSRRSLQEKLK